VEVLFGEERGQIVDADVNHISEKGDHPTAAALLPALV
jgi:hypothetical protein